MASCHRPTRRCGFSRPELIIAIAVLGAVAGLVLAVLPRIRTAANKLESQNNLRQIILSMQSAHDAHRRLPPAIGFYPIIELPKEVKDPLAEHPALHGTVFFHIMPFLESNRIWSDSKGMSRNAKAFVPVYVAPGDFTLPANEVLPDGQGAVSYAANGYVLGGGSYDKEKTAYFSRRTLGEIADKDGTSNTIAFAERFARCVATGPDGEQVDYLRAWSEDSRDRTPFSPVVWDHELPPQFWAAMNPDANGTPCNPEAFQAFGSVINVAMFDGWVRSVNSNISAATWSNVMRDDDGNELGEDFPH